MDPVQELVDALRDQLRRAEAERDEARARADGLAHGQLDYDKALRGAEAELDALRTKIAALADAAKSGRDRLREFGERTVADEIDAAIAAAPERLMTSGGPMNDPICRICGEPKSAHVATDKGPFTHPREARGEGIYVLKSFGTIGGGLSLQGGDLVDDMPFERWEFVPKEERSDDA